MMRAAVSGSDGSTTEAPRGLPWPWRVGALLATLAAGAVLALVVAYWGWRWFGPKAPPSPPAPAPAATAEAIIAAAPFGRPPAAAPGAKINSVAGATLPADARLLGVFAGRDGEGYALLLLADRGPVLARRGEEIISGVKLDAVLPNGIRIAERGAVREIELRKGSAPMSAAPPAGPRAGGGIRVAQRSAACSPPAGFNGPIYRLNAELLAGMAAQPQSWAALLEPEAGALVVHDETGLAEMLGMRTGDRIVQANGIALSAIDDLLAAVVKPLSASRPVRVSGTRKGRPREWLFLNASACPT